jgi:hypothetical protein
MRYSNILKAAVVCTMGVIAFATPARAAPLEVCYTCYTGDLCPPGEIHDVVCQDIGGTLCPVASTCVELSSLCPGYQVLLTCQGSP